MGLEELEVLEKAGIISQCVTSWLRSIVIVPKEAQLGEQTEKCSCVEFYALNSLLPPVVKAHSKPQGVLSLVLLLQIDKIYAMIMVQLCIIH